LYSRSSGLPWKHLLIRVAWLWRWLTEPSPAVSEPDQRRQAQLLAGIMLSVVPLGLLLTIIPVRVERPELPIFLDPEFQVAASAFIFCAFSYGVSRPRHYKVAAAFALTAGSVAIFIAAIPDTPALSMNILVFLILPIILASTLLSLRATAIVAAGNLVGMVIFAYFVPQITLLDILTDAFSFVLLASIIVLLIAHHRNLLEADRRALLSQNEQRLRRITDNVGDMICQVDTSGIIQYASPSFGDVLGYRSERLVGQSIFAGIHPDDVATAKQLFEQGLVTGITERFVHRALHANGAYLWLEAVGSILYDHQGTPGGVIIISRDISERKLMEQRQLEMAVEKNRADLLRQFLGGASHDLLTPLTIIKSSLYLLRRLDVPEKRERHLDMLEEQANRLQRLLDDFLRMSRLTLAEASEFNFAPVDVNHLVEDVIGEYRPVASKKRHQIEFVGSRGLLLSGDAAYLKRALSHLVINAVTYTLDGGKITVQVLDQEEWIVIEVRDTGIGMQPLELMRIFEPFYRADTARNIDTGGTGLGLSIAQRIIVAHGGRLEAESTPGAGSVFRVTLPRITEVQTITA